MQFYPSYTLRTALDEYASVFFTLLNYGYRLQGQRYLILSQIASLPFSDDKEARMNFLSQLEWLSKDPDDILNSDEYGTVDDLKKMLG